MLPTLLAQFLSQIKEDKREIELVIYSDEVMIKKEMNFKAYLASFKQDRT